MTWQTLVDGPLYMYDAVTYFRLLGWKVCFQELRHRSMN